MKLMSRGALDPRWTRHHTPVAASFMLATIKVIRKAPTTAGVRPTYDPVTQTWQTNGSGFGEQFVDEFEDGNVFATILDNVSARVQPYGIIGDMVVGQDTTGRRLIRVQIENVETAIHVDDIVIVKFCKDNPELTKYTIEVRGALGSSNEWLTDLVCEADVKADT